MDKKSSPAFTMSSRLKQTIEKFTPGPMTYRQNLTFIKNSKPNAVIGKALRQTFKPSEGPAPGQYDIERPLRPKSSCAVFSTYKQPQLKQEKRKLGPGCYEPDYDKVMRKSVSSCRFNKSPKNKDLTNAQKSKKPGPMTYDPNISVVKTHDPIIKFGSSLRVDQSKLKATIPGPGKYETQSMKTYRSESAFRFSQQKRQGQIKLKQKTPGPLDYKIQGQFDSNVKQKKGFKFLTKQRQLHSSMIRVPGPTAYNSEINLSLNRAPAFSITHSGRKETFVLNKEGPGPQRYNPQSPPKKRAGSALITASRRQLQKQIEKKKAIPGPGSYEKAFEFKGVGSGVKFTIPKSKIEKQKQRQIEKRPGPWSYNPIQAMKESIKYGTLGKSQRQSLAKKTVPGPGDYEIKDKSNKGIKIGTEKRSKEKQVVVPGPNSYSIPSTIGITKYYQKKKKEK